MENKAFYVQKIKVEKYSLEQLAEEMKVKVPTLRRYIKAAYEKVAWANKLIGIAEENGRHSDVAAPCSGTKRGALALVDTSIVYNYPDSLKDCRIIIPRFCMSELKKIKLMEADPKQKARYEEILRNYPMEEIYEDKLPALTVRMPECKPRNVMFARYVLRMREIHPRIKVLTCSREVKMILDANGVKY